MRRKVALLAACLVAAIFLPSCWDSRELDTLGIVGAFGIDADGEGVLVSVQVLRTCGGQSGSSQGGGGEGEAFTIVRARGSTVFEAVRSLSRIASRRPYFPHTQAILVGEEMAKRGMQGLLDFVARDLELRPRMNIIVCKGKASDFLNADAGLDRIPALAYKQLVDNRGATSQVPSATFAEFAGKMLTDHSAVIATLAETFIAEQQSDLNQSPSAAPKEPSNLSPDKGKIRFRLIGSAVFKGLRMIGTLDEIETRGHQWLTGKVQSGVIVLPNVQGSGKSSVEIVSAESLVRPTIGSDGNLAIDIKVKAEGALGEQETLEDQSTPDALEKLALELETQISVEIFRSLNKARELETDIFQFGEKVRRFAPKQWELVQETWSEQFLDVPVNVEVDASMVRFGIISNGGRLR